MVEGKPDYFLFIINPKAGRRNSSDLAGRIRSVFPEQPENPVCAVITTDRPGHATELAAACARDFGPRAVVFACGGDGTAREVANGLVGTATAMGILPIGTANDFAHAALSSISLDYLLPRLPQPAIRPIDVIEADGRICLNIASLGFDTKVQLKASRINARCRWLGSLSYPLAIVLSLFGGREYPMHYKMQAIDAAGELTVIEADARFILAAICNGRYYGGGFNPAPQAKLDDGQLFFCLVDCLPLRRVLSLIPRYKKGTHLGDPAVHGWSIVSGQIRATEGLLLGNYDGETFARQSVDFRVLPGALRFAFY